MKKIHTITYELTRPFLLYLVARYHELFNITLRHCYHLPSLFHCFILSLKPTFTENLILHLSLFLSVGLISWL